MTFLVYSTLWSSLTKWFNLDWIKTDKSYNMVLKKMFKPLNFLKSKKNVYKWSSDKDKK